MRQFSKCNWFQVHEIFTDALFWSPGLTTLKHHEDGLNSESSPSEASRYAIYFSQADYGESIHLLLGVPLTSNLYIKSTMNERLSQSIVQYMTNFIHFG